MWVEVKYRGGVVAYINGREVIGVAEAQGEYADRIGPELMAQCRQIYLDRLNYARQHCPEAYGQIHFSTDHRDWQQLDARLFELAAQVQKKLSAR